MAESVVVGSNGQIWWWVSFNGWVSLWVGSNGWFGLWLGSNGWVGNGSGWVYEMWLLGLCFLFFVFFFINKIIDR